MTEPLVHEQTITIDASARRVWQVLADVERWPTWTATVQRVERLENGELAVGSTARIEQPRLPALIWRVTSLVPEREFTWESKALGVRTIASHRLEPLAAARTQVTLAVRQEGFAVAMMRGRLEKLAREYVGNEARGLKARCEADDVTESAEAR